MIEVFRDDQWVEESSPVNGEMYRIYNKGVLEVQAYWYVATDEDEARSWRDSELKSSDHIAMVLDWPNREAILEYRQALRQWPESEDFPEVKPVM